jgi:hypothetical protein
MLSTGGAASSSGCMNPKAGRRIVHLAGIDEHFAAT